MDSLDRCSLAAVAVLVCALAVVLALHWDDPRPTVDVKAARQQAQFNPEAAAQVKVARNLLNAGNLGEAKKLIDGLQKKFPYDDRPFMLLADFFMRRQEPLPAMVAYRRAIELNPDYLDKKAKVFQGKKIKVNLEEARIVIEQGLTARPDDRKLQEMKKTYYYMQRRIAGSCG